MAIDAAGRFVAVPLEDRIWSHVDASGDCWEWTGTRSKEGYGRVTLKRPQTAMAHRAVWSLLVGPISVGMTLDHLCRNPSCVNPDHLEPVSLKSNLRRSQAQISTRNAAKTHCKQGHEFTEENTYRRADRPHHRGCRSCRAVAVKRARSNVWL